MQIHSVPVQNAVGKINMVIEATLERQLSNDGNITEISFYLNFQTLAKSGSSTQTDGSLKPEFLEKSRNT